MESGGIKSNQALPLITTTTSGGRSGHLKLLAAAMAASAMSVETPREHDHFHGGEMSLGRSIGGGGWKYGQQRTSGQGVAGAAKARKLRKTKKKMRQQSRKK